MHLISLLHFSNYTTRFLRGISHNLLCIHRITVGFTKHTHWLILFSPQNRSEHTVESEEAQLSKVFPPVHQKQEKKNTRGSGWNNRISFSPETPTVTHPPILLRLCDSSKKNMNMKVHMGKKRLADSKKKRVEHAEDGSVWSVNLRWETTQWKEKKSTFGSNPAKIKVIFNESHDHLRSEILEYV